MKKNSIAPTETNEIESAGMPSLGKPRRKDQVVKMLVLSAIGIAGVGWAVMGAGGAHGHAAQAQAHETEVASQLAPLALPDKPAPLDAPPPLSVAPAAAKPLDAEANATPSPHVITWEERKLGFTADGGVASGAAQSPAAASRSQEPDVDRAATEPATPGRDTEKAPTALNARLEASPIETGRATLLPDRNFIITAGTLLDCVLDTDIDSTLPGKVKIHLDRDQYSANKQVLLMERGTELIGEMAKGILRGEERQFVVFQRATTPNGAAVNLNSPATDAMGATGITGWVDSQFGKRFGAAIGIALMEDATAIAVAGRSGGGGRNTIVLGNTTQAASSMAEKALESSVNIPEILHARHGTRVQVMLARDLDFSDVYGLERTGK